MPSYLTCEFGCNALETFRVKLMNMKRIFVGVHDQVLKADYLLSKDRGFNEQLIFIIFQFIPPHFAMIIQQLFRLIMFLSHDCVRPPLFCRARIGEYESSLLVLYIIA